MMASNNLAAFSKTKKTTPQSQKAAKGQKKNDAGGYAFVVSPLARAQRFLLLGSEGSYYVSGQKMTADNGKNLIKLIEKGHSTELVDLITTISTEGRASKQDYGIFALAVAASHGTTDERSYALSKLPEVARTATTFFMFIGFVKQFRGWGPALRRAVANWYLDRDVDSFAYQVVKYRQREGYTHRDVFRLAHPKTTDAAVQGLGEWILRKDASEAPKIVKGFVKAQKEGADLPKLIAKYRLSWEMLPTEALNREDVWNTLLDTPGALPLGALIRQLPRLTNAGVIKSLGGRTQDIVDRLTDEEQLKKARIHPVNILVAAKTYSLGKSIKGSTTWTPEPRILDALDKAFYLAFKTITPAGKRYLIGLDVSGSMAGGYYGFDQDDMVLTPREVTAAFSLVIAATEKETLTLGFTGYLGGGYGYRYGREESGYSAAEMEQAVTKLDITPSQRIDQVVHKISNLPMGPTDCALPMMYALEHGIEVDTFLIMTDNDTWSGTIHPSQALEKYRKATGIDAKLVVFSTSANRASIADPDDLNSLDIAGFDSAAPQIITEFSRGL